MPQDAVQYLRKGEMVGIEHQDIILGRELQRAIDFSRLGAGNPHQLEPGGSQTAGQCAEAGIAGVVEQIGPVRVANSRARRQGLLEHAERLPGGAGREDRDGKTGSGRSVAGEGDRGVVDPPEHDTAHAVPECQRKAPRTGWAGRCAPDETTNRPGATG
jgi:hypothetical protein